MKALIDGDMIIFKAGFANERSEKGVLLEVNPVEYALHSAKRIIHEILEATGATDFRVFIGGGDKPNFRYKVAKTSPYKANRADKKRPEHELALREYLIRHWSAEVVNGAEVDDVLGIEQDKDGDTTIIVSNDKDLDMIPGFHYDPEVGTERTINGKKVKMKAHKKKALYKITDPGFLKLERVNGVCRIYGGGSLWFCAQMLMGDSTDGIPKINKGYGPAKVYEVLHACISYEDAISKAWKTYVKELRGMDTGQVKERFIEMSKLLWIKRKNGREEIFKQEWIR